MAKSAYQLWKEAKEKEKQRKAEGKIHFKEDSRATRLQTTLPQYTGQSKDKSYKWEGDLLKPLQIKKYGRSYNDKFDRWAKEQGMSAGQAQEYRRSMDFQEDRKPDSGRVGSGAMLQSELMDEILNDMTERMKKTSESYKQKAPSTEKGLNGLTGFLEDFNRKADESTKQAAKNSYNKGLSQTPKPASKKKKDTVLTNVKDFFTGKDTDNDGDRDGLLGAIDRFVLPISKGATEFLAPGNNERMIQNDIQKDGKLNNPVNKASLVNRGTETKVLNTTGALLAALTPYNTAYKGVDVAFNKIPKLAQTITNPYAQKAIKGAVAGGLAEGGISAANELVNSEAYDKKDHLKRIGMGAAGGAVLDPALYGAGKAISKGAETFAANTMKKLLPQNEQVANDLAELIRPEMLPPQPPMPKLTMSSVFENIVGYPPKTSTPAPIKPNTEAIAPLPLSTPGTKPIGPVSLKTIQPTKAISSMSREELQTVRQDLLNQMKSVKGNKQQAKALQEDLEQVEGLLMKLDLQHFGSTAEEVAENTIKHSEVPPAVNVVDEIQSIKDISQLQTKTTNIYEIADRLPSAMGDNIKRSLDAAKVKYTNQLKAETDELYNQVVKGLGIKKGSKQSALVQDFGEKTLAIKHLESRGIDPKTMSPQGLSMVNLEQLKLKAPDNWENIVRADKFFRETYGRLIDEVNAVRSRIYPNSPDKQVPKRQDYYHHFNELEGLEGLKNLFDSPANISPQLEGLSPFTRPSSKFQGFMQKRGNGGYKSDAVGGFLKYVKAASHSINVDPVIPVLRSTSKHLAEATEHTANANKIIEALNDHANDLAGKTNPVDRSVQGVAGRKTMKIITAINSRVKSNMILGNVGSLLAQTGSIPLGVAKAKQYIVPGLKNTMVQSFKELLHGNKSAPVYKSQFLKERFVDENFVRFDQKLIDQPKKLAVWAMSTVDKMSSRTIWNSMYAKAVKEKVKDPIKYADYETRKLIAGRGVGEVPLLQKANTTQVLAPFTLEVANQWKVLAEMIGKKDAAGVITYLVAAYGINQAYEHIRGSNVVFDPVDAILDGYKKGEGGAVKKSLNAAGSLVGETIGNIPGGSIGLQMLGATGVNTKEIFGDRNPSRFGAGLALGKAVKNPTYAVLPWGANQLNKAADGVKAMANGGVYKEDKILGFFENPNPMNNPKEELMYPIERDLLKDLKLVGFGPSATPEARSYYENERKPLTADQTMVYKFLEEEGLGDEFYDVIRVQETKASVKAKFTKIAKDMELSDDEKIAALEELLAEVRRDLPSGYVQR
jgi:hypothetical protein